MARISSRQIHACMVVGILIIRHKIKSQEKLKTYAFPIHITSRTTVTFRMSGSTALKPHTLLHSLYIRNIIHIIHDKVFEYKIKATN